MTLLIRQSVKRFKESPDKIRMLSEKDFFKKKEEMWNKEVTRLTKRVQELEEVEENYEQSKLSLADSDATISGLEKQLDDL